MDGMDFEGTLGLVATVWLIGSFLLMAQSIQRGRSLADELEMRHPRAYEELGRPRPGYFDSVRRTRFAVFVAKREYDDLGDPSLSARFETHRKSDARLVPSILASGALLAVFALAARQ